MNKFDKGVKLIIAIIGEIFSTITNLIKYMLGLIWITYRAFRGRNFINMFHKLNDSFINEIKASLYVIRND